MRFSAEIQHSEDTFRRLSEVQYYSFNSLAAAAWVLSAIVCIFLALFSTGGSFQYIFLFIGCWMMVSCKVLARRNGEKMIRCCKNDFPFTSYNFFEKKFEARSDDTANAVNYCDLFEIMEDRDNYFFFLNKYSGYMIPKNSIKPENDTEFRELIEMNTGRKIEKAATIFNLNLHRIFRTKKTYKR